MKYDNVAEIYRGLKITNCTGFATGTFSVYTINCMAVSSIENARRAVDIAHGEGEREGRWLAGPKPSWIA